MDLDENIEQLVQVITCIKNQVNDLQYNDINIRLNELEHEKETLKDELADMRRILIQQNEMILSLIIQQNNRLLEAGKRYDFSSMFPLKTLQELDELEEKINDNNINELEAVLKLLLQPKGLVKNITFVMTTSLIMECNIDGQQNKRRLLNSPKFMDLIYRTAYNGVCSRESYLNEFRRSLHVVKNRCNQRIHHKKYQGKKKNLPLEETFS